MKNLSKINQDFPVKKGTINLEDVLFDLQKNQVVKGEARSTSVSRTVSFFNDELPERLFAKVKLSSSMHSRLRGALVLKKTKVLLISSIQPTGEILELFEEYEHLFFDDEVIDDLIAMTNAVLDELRYEIKNRQRRILILAEQTEQAKRNVMKNLVQRSWQNLALLMPPPMPNIPSVSWQP